MIFLGSEVLQIVTSRNKLGVGTNDSYPHHVVVMLFVVVVVFVVHVGDGDKMEYSLIPLSVRVIFVPHGVTNGVHPEIYKFLVTRALFV